LILARGLCRFVPKRSGLARSNRITAELLAGLHHPAQMLFEATVLAFPALAFGHGLAVVLLPYFSSFSFAVQ
jgi:hypothetical protein